MSGRVDITRTGLKIRQARADLIHASSYSHVSLELLFRSSSYLELVQLHIMMLLGAPFIREATCGEYCERSSRNRGGPIELLSFHH